MLRPRIIPCLLLRNRALVKTIGFAAPTYVGDPINAVRIFNEKAADELLLIDIEATPQRREPHYPLIATIAAECRMPLCYGGGVHSLDQIDKICSLGVEKIALSTAAIDNPGLIDAAAARLGSQSIVVVLDAKQESSGAYRVYTNQGTKETLHTPSELARQLEARGAGEVVINNIDRDGRMSGYDHALISSVRDAVRLPITALGGAGSLTDINQLLLRFGTIGAAAGSLFVFKGRHRAVLINYPPPDVRHRLSSPDWKQNILTAT